MRIASSNCLPDPIHSFKSAVAWSCFGVLAVVALWLLTALAARGRAQGASEADPVRPALAKRPHVAMLDGYRAVLICLTIVHNSLAAIDHYRCWFLCKGLWAMPFFFVLSGFVMTYVAAGKIRHFTLASGAETVALRVARLIPLYWVALWSALLLAAAGIIDQEPYMSWPLQVSFLQPLVPMKACGPSKLAWSNYVQFEANTPGWFTAALIFCSIFFPILFNLRTSLRWRGTLATLLLVCVLDALPSYTQAWLPVYGEEGGLDLYSFAPMRLLEFGAGVLAAHLIAELPEEVRSWRFWGLIADAALVVAFVLVHVFPIAPLAFGVRGKYGSVAHGNYFVTPWFCLACAGYSLAAQDGKGSGDLRRGILGMAASWGPLTRVAKYAFGAYILQLPLFELLKAVLPHSISEHWPIICIHLALCWLCSYPLTEFIELPLHNLARRFLAEPAKTSAAGLGVSP